MNTKLLLISFTAVGVFASCANQDPEYKAWKKEQEAKKAAQANNANNPFDVPGVDGETGQGAPYQPLPGVPSDTANIPVPDPAPGVGGSSNPSGPVTTHEVVKGDTLSSLARRYGSSVTSIQEANGMTDTIIRIGQTLKIPSN